MPNFAYRLVPKGGDNGGRIIADGTPEKVARIEGSYTGLSEESAGRAEKRIGVLSKNTDCGILEN